MAVRGYVGGAFVPAKGVSAYVGAAWKQAKSVRLYQNGAWVSVLQTAVTATRTPATGSIQVGSSITLAATPSIPSLVSAWEWWWSNGGTTWTKSSVTTTSFVWTPTANDVSSNFQFKAVAVQYDGSRVESAPVVIVVTGTSTVGLTGPDNVMSIDSASNGSKALVSPVFTVTVGSPSVVTKVSLQQRHVATQSTFTEIKAWTTGITSSLSYTSTLAAEGVWETKAVITTPAGLVTSTVKSTDCIKRSVTATVSNTAPTVGTVVRLTAAMSSAAPSDFVNTPLGWEYSNASVGWTTWTKNNPHDWTTVDTAHNFRWGESFPDGSKIYSNTVTVDAKPAPATSISGAGTNTTADPARLQSLLNQAFNEKLPLTLTGTWALTGKIYIPPNVKVTATGAVFRADDGGNMFANMGTPAGATIVSSDYTALNGGGYKRAGGFVWTGGTFNANNKASTAFSLSHSPGYTIQNVTIYNTTSAGHAIENNSSGGPPSTKRVDAMDESEFTVRILNNTFLGMSVTRRDDGDDEAIHWDYAWIRDDGLHATSLVVNDGTVCNKILIKGNVIKHDSAKCTYPYPSGAGHHHSITDNAGGRALPDAPSKQIRIVGNTFQDIWAGTIHKGAVHIHSGSKEVIVSGNTFLRCTRPVAMEPKGLPTAWESNATEKAATLPQWYWITNNTFNACGKYGSGGNHAWIDTAVPDEGGDFWNNVYVTGNTFTGAIPSTQSTYLISTREVHTHSVSSNKFWGLTGGAGGLSAKDGNRIHGTAADPAGASTGMTLDNNTWSSAASGASAVEQNS